MIGLHLATPHLSSSLLTVANTGSAASFIIMMLPPKSGRKAVRLRNASTIAGLSYLFSHLTTIWLGSAESFEPVRQEKGDDIRRSWPLELREKVVALAEQLQDLRVRTVMSKWEGSVRGAWAFEEYNRLIELQDNMLANLILVCVLFWSWPSEEENR